MSDGYSYGATWVVAAVAQELGPIPGLSIGIGSIDAALGMARQISRERPDRVILVGSCGAYRPDHEIGTAVVGVETTWRSAGEVAKLAYGVGSREVLRADPELISAFELPRARVVTTPAITCSASAAEALGREGDVEHLETWGVARACAMWGVPFVSVLGVANRVGPDAHAEWKAHREEAERAAWSVVQRWVDENSVNVCPPGSVGGG